MPWPLEPEGIRDFATGLEQIIVVEEKRGLVEDQLRKHLYGLANAPVIVGKCDEKGQWLFPSNGELGSGLIAARLGKRILARGGDAELSARVARLVDEGATLSGLRAEEGRVGKGGVGKG